MICMMIATYFIGAISFTSMIAWWAERIDITKVGSGNPGTANAFRALGLWWGCLCFVCDAAKGAWAILLSKYINKYYGVMIIEDWMIIVLAIIAIIGHSFSPFVRGLTKDGKKIKGGKGVATFCGSLIAIKPEIALLGLLIYAITVVRSRYSSLGSLLGTTGVWVYAHVLFINSNFSLTYYIFISVIVALIFVLHKKNILNLLLGTEPKLSFQGITKEELEQARIR